MEFEFKAWVRRDDCSDGYELRFWADRGKGAKPRIINSVTTLASLDVDLIDIACRRMSRELRNLIDEKSDVDR